jgi:plasmid stabilization system protein ParE
LARLVYSDQAFTDLARLTKFLLEANPQAANATIGLITDAVSILEFHPLIGRPVEDLHELVISRGRSGYVALYSFEEEFDAVLILSIRHQREAGYPSSEG